MSRLGANTLGIDVTEANIKMAQLHASNDPYFTEDNLNYRYISAEDLLHDRKESFDAVCAMEVLEHVDKPSEFLKSCADLVKVS